MMITNNSEDLERLDAGRGTLQSKLAALAVSKHGQRNDFLLFELVSGCVSFSVKLATGILSPASSTSATIPTLRTFVKG